jgi:hypothetical protein
MKRGNSDTSVCACVCSGRKSRNYSSDFPQLQLSTLIVIIKTRIFSVSGGGGSLWHFEIEEKFNFTEEASSVFFRVNNKIITETSSLISSLFTHTSQSRKKAISDENNDTWERKRKGKE